jgi:hypothetical protein
VAPCERCVEGGSLHRGDGEVRHVCDVSDGLFVVI